MLFQRPVGKAPSEHVCRLLLAHQASFDVQGPHGLRYWGDEKDGGGEGGDIRRKRCAALTESVRIQPRSSPSWLNPTSAAEVLWPMTWPARADTGQGWQSTVAEARASTGAVFMAARCAVRGGAHGRSLRKLLILSFRPTLCTVAHRTMPPRHSGARRCECGQTNWRGGRDRLCAGLGGATREGRCHIGLRLPQPYAGILLAGHFSGSDRISGGVDRFDCKILPDQAS